MSESSDEDFSDSDSVKSEQEEPKKIVVNGKRKVAQKNGSKSSDDSSDNESVEQATAPKPVKKRKTLQDYLNEKVKPMLSAKKLRY